MPRPTPLMLLAALIGGCAAPQLDMAPASDHPASADAAPGEPPLRSRALAEPATPPEPGPAPATDHTGHEHHGGHQ